jgi:hypothetical protein
VTAAQVDALLTRPTFLELVEACRALGTSPEEEARRGPGRSPADGVLAPKKRAFAAKSLQPRLQVLRHRREDTHHVTVHCLMQAEREEAAVSPSWRVTKKAGQPCR